MNLDFQAVKNGAVSAYDFLNDNMEINAFRSGMGKTRLSLPFVHFSLDAVGVSII